MKNKFTICRKNNINMTLSLQQLCIQKFIDNIKTFKEIQEWIIKYGKVLIFLGEGQHKIKRKAEQIACNEALQKINSYSI